MPGVLGYASNINMEDLLKYTNRRRASEGLNSLTVDTRLMEAAQRKASHMFINNYWAHIAPDGTDPWSFIIGADYDYIYAGENLAKNFSTSKDVVEAWYNSPSHRENLLSDKYSDVGFAAVNGVLDGYETTLVVQMFGKTRNFPAQIAVKGVDDKITAIPAMEPIKVTAPKMTVSSELSVAKINVYSSTKIFTLTFASVILILLLLDAWYSKKHSILKFSGHSFAHMVFLIFAMTVIYFSLQPGRLI